jgi:hypothetical protein
MPSRAHRPEAHVYGTQPHGQRWRDVRSPRSGAVSER